MLSRNGGSTEWTKRSFREQTDMGFLHIRSTRLRKIDAILEAINALQKEKNKPNKVITRFSLFGKNQKSSEDRLKEIDQKLHAQVGKLVIETSLALQSEDKSKFKNPHALDRLYADASHFIETKKVQQKEAANVNATISQGSSNTS